MNRHVTVVMSVFNGESSIKKCLDSIFQQSYDSIDLVICDDGSSDNTIKIIKNYSINNKRFEITLLENKKNLGLPASLNRCIDQAKGFYLARMDADDEMMPDRIIKQVLYLEANPAVTIVGGGQLMMLGDGALRANIPPKSNKLIKANLFFRTTMLHPTVMLRKRFLLDHEIKYDVSCHLCEDYKFFLDHLYAGATFGNLACVVNSYDYSTPKKWDSHHEIMDLALKSIWLKNLNSIGLCNGEEYFNILFCLTGKDKVTNLLEYCKVVRFLMISICMDTKKFGGFFVFTIARLADALKLARTLIPKKCSI